MVVLALVVGACGLSCMGVVMSMQSLHIQVEELLVGRVRRVPFET